MEKKWLFDIEVRNAADEQRMVAEVAYALCWRYWRDKIDLVVKRWQGLERVEVRCAAGDEGERILFEGGEWRWPGEEGEEWRGLLEEGKAGSGRWIGRGRGLKGSWDCWYRRLGGRLRGGRL